jgi:hypothetical protein
VIACPPITTCVAPADYTYQVRVDQGSASCADARRVLRGYVVRATPAAAWTCFRGNAGDSWAAACAKGNAIARAYGPRREHHPWRIAAGQADITFLRPTIVARGLRLAFVSVTGFRACARRVERLRALYKTSEGDVELIEEHGCGKGLAILPPLGPVLV